MLYNSALSSLRALISISISKYILMQKRKERKGLGREAAYKVFIHSEKKRGK